MSWPRRPSIPYALDSSCQSPEAGFMYLILPTIVSETKPRSLCAERPTETEICMPKNKCARPTARPADPIFALSFSLFSICKTVFGIRGKDNAHCLATRFSLLLCPITYGVLYVRTREDVFPPPSSHFFFLPTDRRHQDHHHHRPQTITETSCAFSSLWYSFSLRPAIFPHRHPGIGWKKGS